MATNNIERSSCTSRAFSLSDSFLYNFKRWIEGTPIVPPVAKSTGGAGWEIIDDRTSESPPYIVVSNHSKAVVDNTPNKFDDPHKILQVIESTTAGKVEIKAFMWWDTFGHQGFGQIQTGIINAPDGTTFNYDFRGGLDFISIGANDLSSWNFFVIGDWAGDLRFLKGPTVAAEIKNAPAAGTDVWINFIDTATASNFTLNDYFFIFDVDNASHVEYVKVIQEDFSNNRVQVNAINAAFTIDSVMTAYTHRYFIHRNIVGSAENTPGIPYCSFLSANGVSSTYRGPFNSIKVNFGYNEAAIDKMDPDDEGRTAVQKPFIVEANNALGQVTEMNRIYGPLKHIYLSSTNGLVQMTTARTIGGNNYIYLDQVLNRALLLPDWNTLTLP